MAIDRIGKGGAPQVSTGVPGVAGERAGSVAPTRSFETHLDPQAPPEGAPAAAAGEVGSVAATPLDRLRSGQVDLNGYLDLKVDEATTHLHGLGPEQLGELKELLRNELASDPGLVDLVKQSTGSIPATPGDE